MSEQLRTRAPADPSFMPGPIHGAVLAMMAWLTVIASGILSPVLPKIAAHYGPGPDVDLKVGLVATMPALAVALLALPIGHIGDRFGARRVLLFGLLAYGIAGVVPYWLNSLDAIIATRFVVGVGEAAAMSLSTALIALSYSGATRQRWLGIQVASANVVGVLTLFAGGFIGRLSWRAPFIAYAFALVLFLLAITFVRQPSMISNRAVGSGRLTFSEIRSLALKCAWVMVITLSIAVLVIHMAFLFTERGVTDSGILGLAIGGSAMGIAVGAAAGGLVARVPPRVVLGVGYALIAAGFALIAQPFGVVATALVALPVGLGCGLATTALLAATFSNARESTMGVVSGLYTASIFVGQFASTPIIAFLKSVAGSLSGAILLLALAVAAVAVIVLLTGAGTQSRSTSTRGSAAPDAAQ
jgi:MFS family permease